MSTFKLNDVSFVSAVTDSSVATTGLILDLDANNKKSYLGGTVWMDLSSKQNTGILGSSITYDAGNGGSMNFHGLNNTNDRIVISNTTDLSNLVTNNLWSVEFWYYQQSVVLYGGFVIFNNTGIISTKGQTVGILIGGNNAANSGVLPVNSWTHIVGINNNGTYSIYLNGSLNMTGFVSDTGYGLGSIYALGWGIY